MTTDELIASLEARIEDTDLEYYAGKPAKLRYAIDYAISAVNLRRGFSPTEEELFEARFRMNVLEGAAWYLAKIGAEGYASTSENGVSVSWQEMPDWLRQVPCPVFVR